MGIPWDGMGWDRKICPMDKPEYSTIHLSFVRLTCVGLKKNYLLKQILCSLIFLDETFVDMHTSAFLCLLLFPFSHGACVILPVLIDSMLFFGKKCVTLKKNFFCSKHQN